MRLPPLQVTALAVRLMQLDPDLGVATLRERGLSNTRNGILSAFYEEGDFARFRNS